MSQLETENEIQIVWKDPPPKETRSKWVDLLAPFRERPGQWAMIRADAPNRVSNLRQRLSKTAAIKGQFELRAHRISEGQSELYVRYAPSADGPTRGL